MKKTPENKKRVPTVFTPKQLRFNRALFEGKLSRRNQPKIDGYRMNEK